MSHGDADDVGGQQQHRDHDGDSGNGEKATSDSE